MTEPFVGSIQYFAFGFAPRGWATCSGQVMQVTQNQALFALIGTLYGGDGRTTFQLPDLQGRSMVGFGLGNPPQNVSSYTIGTKGGTESGVLPLPSHTHTATLKIAANSSVPNSSEEALPVGTFPAAPKTAQLYAPTLVANSFLGAPQVSVTTAGAGTPISFLSPYVALTCCIALTGLFPSRN